MATTDKSWKAKYTANTVARKSKMGIYSRDNRGSNPNRLDVAAEGWLRYNLLLLVFLSYFGLGAN
jgi:hypothetical protein